MSKWIIMGSLAAVWLFGAELLIGLEMPAHHFERFDKTGYYSTPQRGASVMRSDINQTARPIL